MRRTKGKGDIEDEEEDKGDKGGEEVRGNKENKGDMEVKGGKVDKEEKEDMKRKEVEGNYGQRGHWQPWQHEKRFLSCGVATHFLMMNGQDSFRKP